MTVADQTGKTPVAIVLGSSSVYRRTLLARLIDDFLVDSPDIDETRLERESPGQYVTRLAHDKAQTVACRHPHSIVIGSDQCAEIDSEILGKPGRPEVAITQLLKLSGRLVRFHTGLCVIHTGSGEIQQAVEPYEVQFRALDRAEVERYVAREKPLDCAGSFKSEGLGISLFEKMIGDDPTSLMGLPLIRLRAMLHNAGLAVP